MNVASFTLTGIVDSISAQRKGENVTSLKAKVRIETPFDNPHYGSDKVIDEIHISLDPLSAVNAGDVVSVDVMIVRPIGQRFAHALEMQTNEDDVNEAVVNTSQDA